MCFICRSVYGKRILTEGHSYFFVLHCALRAKVQKSNLLIVRALFCQWRIMFNRQGQLTIESAFYRPVANTLAALNAIVFIAQT